MLVPLQLSLLIYCEDESHRSSFFEAKESLRNRNARDANLAQAREMPFPNSTCQALPKRSHRLAGAHRRRFRPPPLGTSGVDYSQKYKNSFLQWHYSVFVPLRGYLLSTKILITT
jgi:hypothetical protein